MAELNKVILDLTIKEANIIRTALSSYSPIKEDEVISFFLYAKITRILEEKNRDK